MISPKPDFLPHKNEFAGGMDFDVPKNGGQISSRPHTWAPNGGLVWEMFLFQGNLGWWNTVL